MFRKKRRAAPPTPATGLESLADPEPALPDAARVPADVLAPPTLPEQDEGADDDRSERSALDRLRTGRG